MTETRDSADLKPCPFCGGKATYERLHTAKWSVGCLEEDGLCFGYQTLTLFDTKKSARAAWNTRADSDRAQHDAEVREALERIASLAPSVTHGWAIEARQIARNALSSPTVVDHYDSLDNGPA